MRLSEPTFDKLNPDEREFLRRADALFRANTDWFEFEAFAFGVRSPLFKAPKSHRHVVENPLYIALRDMWLELGLQQGRIAKPTSEDRNGERRQTRGRGSSSKRTDSKNERDVAPSGPSAHRRSPKGRARRH